MDEMQYDLLFKYVAFAPEGTSLVRFHNTATNYKIAFHCYCLKEIYQ